MEERLQKIMAQSGIGSRRDCEVFIISGRVSVNGVVAVIGQKADPKTDKITVDGKLLKAPEEKIYIALHKPRGVLSAVESEPGDNRQTVRDLLPMEERLYPVGRLDFDSEGLVLMTNDGDLAQRLTHPSHEHEKEYRVLVASHPDDEQLATWRRGVVMEDGYKTLPVEIRIEGAAGKGSWLRIVMKEGRKRQIREIGSLIGLPVARIVRIRIGSLTLGALKPREWRYLSPAEVATLKSGSDEVYRSMPISRPRRYGARKSPGERQTSTHSTWRNGPRQAPVEGQSERPVRRSGPRQAPVEGRSERPARRSGPRQSSNEKQAERPSSRPRPVSNRSKK